MGLLRILGLASLVWMSVICGGELVPSADETTEPAVPAALGSASPTGDAPLDLGLPSVVAFLERLPIFVEYFTTRPVPFAYPAFLANYTLRVASSDEAVGEIAGDGWVELTDPLPMNLSEWMFTNLTAQRLSDHQGDLEANPASLDEAASPSSPAASKDSEKTVDDASNKPARETVRGTGTGSAPPPPPPRDGGLEAALARRLGRLSPGGLAPLAGSFTLIGGRFGKTRLSFQLYRRVDGDLVLDPQMTALARDVDVLNMRIPTAFDMAFGSVMLVLGAVVTGIMGCELEWEPVKKILKRPFGLVIGFCSQFILMPASAFAVCMAFRLQPEHALGIILAACSPGGGLSNMTSVAIDANLLLSISMTFFSTVVALGLMPLNLFIYSRPFQTDDSFPIPFSKIIIGLITMVAPLAAGCLLRHFRRAWALRLVRLLKPVSLVIILFALAGGIYTIRFVFTYIVPAMIGCAFSIPFLAFAIGATAALLCRRGPTEVKTIAVETAVQNVGIGAGIVRLVYPSPDADIITCSILWTLLGQSCLIFTVIGLYTFYAKIIKGRLGLGGKKGDEVDEARESEDKASSVDLAERAPLYEQDEDGQPGDAVATGTPGHAHLSKMSRSPLPPSTGMTAGAYRFWGYRPLPEPQDVGGGRTATEGEPARQPPGLFVTFPRGVGEAAARHLWAPPIIGPTGDVWVPNEDVLKNAPETTV